MKALLKRGVGRLPVTTIATALLKARSWLLTQQVVQEPLLTLTSTHKTLASDGLSTPHHPLPTSSQNIPLFSGTLEKEGDDSGCESIGESCTC